MPEFDLSVLPGGEIVARGLADLHAGLVTEDSLLILIARKRLIEHGFDVPAPINVERPFELRLYERIERRMTNGAHAEYNALIQRIVSFENALDHTHKQN